MRTYSNILRDSDAGTDYFNSQVALVRIAVFLDNLFTGDKIFDIRFLALLYGFFYVPALYLLIKKACNRVKNY